MRSLLVVSGLVLGVTFGALVIFLVLALDAPEPLAAPERGVVLGRVTLLEPGGARRGPVSLRIEGSTIQSIGSPDPDANGDLAGLYMLPGLSDAHAHLPMTGFDGDAEYTVLLFEFKADLNRYLKVQAPDAQVGSLTDLIRFNEEHSDREMPYFGQDILLELSF